ncbi:MAG: hemolysin III family protein [Gemmataceae bacterium]|nr:hemolysin III family protein [Gemmata sp.]MDW8197003.1 hemolysin III family protein [Gemmataceae bacterium]
MIWELRDPVSSASHLLTALWAVFATFVMLRLTSGGWQRRLPIIVYGLSMVALYLASGVFHGRHYDSPEEKRLFQKLDQSAIYLLIAGTATPIMAILLQNPWRKWLLRTVWGLAVVGIASLWLLPKLPHSTMIAFYLALGWVGVLPLPLYYRVVGWRAMNWVWLGAACYSLGAVCELLQWPVLVPGWIQAHEILHFCDTAGSLAFFVFVIRYVLSYPLRPDYDAVASGADRRVDARERWFSESRGCGTKNGPAAR